MFDNLRKKYDDKEITFLWKDHAENVHQRLAPDLFLNQFFISF